MMRWTAAVATAGALVIACGSGKRNGDEAVDTRALMGEIYAALRVALPASLDADLLDAESSAEIGAAIDTLAANAALLESHTRRSDAQVKFLARSAARDAREVRRAWREGRTDRAAFLLSRLTENCVVCHTRLPDAREHPLAAGFLDSEELRGLPPEVRAELQIATRRFDSALATLETLLASEESPALLLGPLTDYLVVSLRVKDDYRRPVPVLERFAARSDLWEPLRRDVDAWIAALPALGARAAGSADLQVARDLLIESEIGDTAPQDRRHLVHMVAASAVLQRFLDAHRTVDRDLGEAYFALGLVEARIGGNYWVSPAPFLLETSIRIAPREPFARQAYALLERELLMLYEGSEDEALPEEDAARLAELRGLIEGR